MTYHHNNNLKKLFLIMFWWYSSFRLNIMIYIYISFMMISFFVWTYYCHIPIASISIVLIVVVFIFLRFWWFVHNLSLYCCGYISPSKADNRYIHIYINKKYIHLHCIPYYFSRIYYSWCLNQRVMNKNRTFILCFFSLYPYTMNDRNTQYWYRE